MISRGLINRFWRVVALLLAGSLSLNACSLLPRSEYTQPQVKIPERWQAQVVTGEAIANRERWWRNFNDPLLDELIELALRNNNDLAAATIRLRRARLQAKLTDTNLTPAVSVSTTSSLNRDINHGSNTQLHGITGSLSYELDLWGKLERTRDSSRWEAEASEADRQNTALLLVGTVAADYWQVAYLNQRIVANEASIAYTEKSLELVLVKYRSGAVSGIEVAQARQAVATQKSALTQLLQQRTQARNALSIIFDQPPETIMRERLKLPEVPFPVFETGLPAILLGHRPDLHAAEMRLREYLANVDVARANFYPTLTLTGSLGSSNASLADVLQNPIASLGVGLLLPFLQWNTMQLTTKVSETNYEEAVVNFRQTLYKALGEVENALSANRYYQAQSEYLEQALSLSGQAEKLAEVRYRSGMTGAQAWLDAQETRRNAETTLDGTRLNRLNNLMTLYQALGGDIR